MKYTIIGIILILLALSLAVLAWGEDWQESKKIGDKWLMCEYSKDAMIPTDKIRMATAYYIKAMLEKKEAESREFPDTSLYINDGPLLTKEEILNNMRKNDTR